MLRGRGPGLVPNMQVASIITASCAAALLGRECSPIKATQWELPQLTERICKLPESSADALPSAIGQALCYEQSTLPATFNKNVPRGC